MQGKFCGGNLRDVLFLRPEILRTKIIRWGGCYFKVANRDGAKQLQFHRSNADERLPPASNDKGMLTTVVSRGYPAKDDRCEIDRHIHQPQPGARETKPDVEQDNRPGLWDRPGVS